MRFLIVFLLLISGLSQVQAEEEGVWDFPTATPIPSKDTRPPAPKAQLQTPAAASPTDNSDSQDSPKSHLQPIDISARWDLARRCYVPLSFTYEGTVLQSYDQLESVINPLQDPQATHLIEAAKDEEAVGWGLIGGGAAAVVIGTIDMIGRLSANYQANVNSQNQSFNNFQATGNLTTPTQTQPDLTVDVIAELIGAGMGLAGLALETNAINDRYSAVTRYNYVVKDENPVSFLVEPGPHQVELGLVQRF